MNELNSTQIYYRRGLLYLSQKFNDSRYKYSSLREPRAYQISAIDLYQDPAHGLKVINLEREARDLSIRRYELLG